MSRRRSPLLFISRGVYRTVLATYPPDIRREYGPEMLQVFAARSEEIGSKLGLKGLLRFWLATTQDFFASASAEWWDWITERTKRSNPTRTKSTRGKTEMLASAFNDVRIAVRQLTKRPAFTSVAVITLALGVGANTAIFSVVHSVLMRPLALANPDEITWVFESNLERGWDRFTVSPPNYLDWVERNEVFSDVGAFTTGSQTLTDNGDPTRLDARYVSASMFPVLGVTPILGRVFRPEENQPGTANVAILSHRLWTTRFGSDPSVVGQSIMLSGVNTEVVGVLPEDFPLFKTSDVWQPLTFDFDVGGARGAHYLLVMGRLRAGVSIEQASAGMVSLAHSLEQEYTANQGWSTVVVPLHRELVAEVETILLVLLGAVAIVLFIACANVANLLLARATSRRQEMALRAALGAGRARLLRQLLTESLVLALAGSALGTLVAAGGLQVLVSMNPGNLPRLEEISIDGTVLLFTFGVAVVSAAAFGLFPALHASRTDLHRGLRAGTGRGGAQGSAARNTLVITQIAMALVLLTGSGLLLRSLQRMQSVDPGFIVPEAVTMRVTLPRSRYPQNEHVAAFYDQLHHTVAAIPGVDVVASTTGLPLGGAMNFSFQVVGRPDSEPANMPTGYFRAVSPQYLRAMGITILGGRDFAEVDRAGAPSVVIVNESLARTYFRDEEALGQTLMIHSGDVACPCQIVGIVSDIKQGDLTANTEPGYYVPFAQSVWRSRTVVARTALQPAIAVDAIRRTVAAIDPSLAIYSVQTLEERVAESVAEPRFNAVMLGIFAGVAVLLAVVGIYGVMNYSVGQRTHELGVRAALGAGSGKLTWLVVAQALGLAVAGVGVGLAAAYGTTRFLAGMLFGVDPLDPVTLGSVALLIVAVASLAAYLPARRAASIDPVSALRGE